MLLDKKHGIFYNLHIVLLLGAYNDILYVSLLLNASVKIWISEISDLLMNTTYL